MDAEVEITGWDDAKTLYFVQTVEWGSPVTRWADDLRAVGRCVAEADAGSTVVIRIPDKPPEELPTESLEENLSCL